MLQFELEQMTATLVLRNTGPNKICFRIHPPRSANYKVLPPAGFVDVRKSTEVQVQRLVSAVRPLDPPPMQKSIQNTDQLTVEFTGDTGVEEAENAFYDNYLDSDKVPVPISAAGAQETGCTVS